MMDRCALRSVSNPEKNSVAGLHPTRFTAKEKRKRKREREREKQKKEKEKKGKLKYYFLVLIFILTLKSSLQVWIIFVSILYVSKFLI